MFGGAVIFVFPQLNHNHYVGHYNDHPCTAKEIMPISQKLILKYPLTPSIAR
jgi:hypothetical protein